jgi:hypothetical protein
MFSIFKRGQDDRPNSLDEYMSGYLTTTYQLLPAETDELGLVEGKKTIADQDIALFRVYDPFVTEDVEDGVTYELLDEFPEAVLFQGRYDFNGNVAEIEDLRSSK